MPPTTRKTAAKKTTTRKTNTGVTNTSVTRKRPAKKVAEPIVQEDTNVSENVENTEATTKRKGPKPNPFVAYEKARAKADKARAAYEKVQRLAEAKEQAEREEQEALSALQAAYEAVGVNPGE